MMTVLNASSTSGAAPRGRRLRRWLALAGGILALVGVATWFLTEPLSDRPVPPPSDDRSVRVEPILVEKVAEVSTAWPEGREEGDGAKALLLASAIRSVEALSRVHAYTATLHKQERIGGVLGPVQTLAMKLRNQPFAIYLKFLAPKEGKEVVYAEGHHENKLVAHNGDWTRRLIPRLAVPIDSPLALADSRHPVTEAGLLALAKKLVVYRQMDVGDPLATTVIDRTIAPDGRPALRSVHTHTDIHANRPFVRVEILYDPETQYPIRIDSFDWPAPGHAGSLDLAESFYYTDIKLDVPLTDLDFDPKNPDYAFMRF